MKSRAAISHALLLPIQRNSTTGLDLPREFTRSAILPSYYPDIAEAVRDFNRFKTEWENPARATYETEPVVRVALFIGGRLVDSFDTNVDGYYQSRGVNPESWPDVRPRLLPVKYAALPSYLPQPGARVAARMATREQSANIPPRTQILIRQDLTYLAAFCPGWYVWARTFPGLNASHEVFVTDSRAEIDASIRAGFVCTYVPPRGGVARWPGFVCPESGRVAVQVCDLFNAEFKGGMYRLLDYPELTREKGLLASGWEPVTRILKVHAMSFQLQTANALHFVSFNDTVHIGLDEAGVLGFGPKAVKKPRVPKKKRKVVLALVE